MSRNVHFSTFALPSMALLIAILPLLTPMFQGQNTPFREHCDSSGCKKDTLYSLHSAV
jgi:hypothetical protein